MTEGLESSTESAASPKIDAQSLEEMMPQVYEELRRLAANYLRGERSEHTLRRTALVHEAYLRLVNQGEVTWQNRAHFLGIFARIMRQRSEEHTSELQSRSDLVCRLLLEKKKQKAKTRAD